MAGGRIVAEGPPSAIGGRDTGRARIRFALPRGTTLGDLPAAAAAGDDGLVIVQTTEPTQMLHRLTGWALGRGAVLDRLTVDRPSLEDVYLRLTSDDEPTLELEGSTR
jgi:ABC-2 type transport system ATP-binding protein